MKDLQPSPSQDLVDHAGTSTQTIPSDLIFEILSLLPAKSIIRLQSVSKLWFSIIRSKYFVVLFLTRSKTRPRLLLTLIRYTTRKRLFFSVPEHNNNDDDKPTTVIARHDMKLHVVYYDGRSSTIPVNGFICFRTVSGFYNSIAVCNPTTRQIVKLPDVRTNGRQVHAHLGYDPVEDEYKVLCVIMKFQRPEYYICTVSSSKKQEWRNIENTTRVNFPYVCEGICVDGAIYYGVGQLEIVKFDVRYEKVELIKVPKESNISTSNSTLIDYKGKLCVVDYDYAYKQDMRLWILEDGEKQEWSSMTCAFPSEWECFGGGRVFIKGVTHTGAELIMEYDLWLKTCKPYYVYYYDFNKESIRKVEIHGMEEGLDLEDGRVFTCPGYVDNIRFL